MRWLSSGAKQINETLNVEFHLVKDGVVKANVTSSKYCQSHFLIICGSSTSWSFLFPSLSSICSFNTQLEGDLLQEAILAPSHVSQSQDVNILCPEGVL